jgi:cysteine desulfurase
MARIYFDHSATTPLDPRVRQAMHSYLNEVFGNPSSLHQEGQQARQAVENARKQVADFVGVRPAEVIFTASGTEADNMALIGVFRALGTPFHLITSAFEHPAILETCRFLERCGASVTYLPVSSDGIVDPDDLDNAIQSDTRLVSIMAANNVVGTLQPLMELARITSERGVLFHTDAVQAAGKIPLNLGTLKIELLSLSAHKLHGPKGIGALIVRQGVSLEPLIYGGGQEGGRRSATENVAGIVGFGAASQVASQVMATESARLVNLRDRLMQGILDRAPQAYLIGHPYRRLPGHLCLGLAGQEGEAIKLLLALDEAGFAVSTGSACSAHKSTEPSYVLNALGFDPFKARGSLRLTLGRFNTDEEIDSFLEVFPKVVNELRPITSH